MPTKIMISYQLSLWKPSVQALIIVHFKLLRFEKNFKRDTTIESSSQWKEEMKEKKNITHCYCYFEKISPYQMLYFTGDKPGIFSFPLSLSLKPYK